jgi:hypothetical protein
LSSPNSGSQPESVTLGALEWQRRKNQRFGSEQMPMNTVQEVAPGQKSVVLLRLGIGVQEFQLPERGTLADVFREAGVDGTDLEVMVNGHPLAEALVLEPGTIESLSPRNKIGGERRWRDSIGMFRDNPEFDEMMARVEAARQAEKHQE